jgi:HlyD family secretion protein
MPSPFDTSPPAAESSDEVQDVISAVPGSIVRCGITVVFFVITALFVMSWIVQYPDVITSRISVTSQNPPAAVVAPISGRLARLAVREGDAVTNGTVLAIIESAADSDAVLRLRDELERLAPGIAGPDRAWTSPPAAGARLGEIQEPAAGFFAARDHFNTLLAETNSATRLALLESQLAQTLILIERLQAERKILLRERALADDNFEKSRKLAAEGILSTATLTEAEAASLVKQREHSAVENAIVNARIQSIEHEKTLHDLRQQRDEQRRMARAALQESFQKLRAATAIWELQHVLKAPVDGTVSFFKIWSRNQTVQAQDEVMTVVPAAGPLLGRIALKERGAGKVRPGQVVRVKLDDFPAQEYGALTATVESISLVPRENNTYLVKLCFAADLKSSYGRSLACKQEAQGDAEIVTARRRLIGRIFHDLRAVISSSAW